MVISFGQQEGDDCCSCCWMSSCDWKHCLRLGSNDTSSYQFFKSASWASSTSGVFFFSEENIIFCTLAANSSNLLSNNSNWVLWAIVRTLLLVSTSLTRAYTIRSTCSWIAFISSCTMHLICFFTASMYNFGSVPTRANLFLHWNMLVATTAHKRNTRWYEPRALCAWFMDCYGSSTELGTIVDRMVLERLRKVRSISRVNATR